MLILSSRGELIFEEENCLDVSKSYAGAPVEILKCHGMGGNQKWEHEKKSVSLHTTALLCYSCWWNFREWPRVNTSSHFRYLLALAYILLKRKETTRQFLKDIT